MRFKILFGSYHYAGFSSIAEGEAQNRQGRIRQRGACVLASAATRPHQSPRRARAKSGEKAAKSYHSISQTRGGQVAAVAEDEAMAEGAQSEWNVSRSWLAYLPSVILSSLHTSSRYNSFDVYNYNWTNIIVNILMFNSIESILCNAVANEKPITFLRLAALCITTAHYIQRMQTLQAPDESHQLWRVNAALKNCIPVHLEISGSPIMFIGILQSHIICF